MVAFDRFVLENGLRVIVHTDKTTPLVAMNILYDVGSKDESPERTGFAHLFEHLMFGGSVNIPDYDQPLQKAAGENNAFTSTDITNYYVTLPAQNIETAFWLESDRMLGLSFSEKSLDVQKGVVIEEFKQRYLNQPYGDIWLLLRPLAYKKHPYRWATIGKDITHISEATLEDVKSFFYTHYAPNNAILVLSGNIDVDKARQLCNKWFAPIEKRKIPDRGLPLEPLQVAARTKTVQRNVPLNAIYKAFHMVERLHPDYYSTDLISDILSNGHSSRLFQRLVKNKRLFSNLDAFISDSMEPGLFMVMGHLMDGVEMESAEKALNEELEKMKHDIISDYELQKVKNKVESAFVFGETNILNKAMSLAYYELLGGAELFNKELRNYDLVSTNDIKAVSNRIFNAENCSTLYYLSDKK